MAEALRSPYSTTHAPPGCDRKYEGKTNPQLSRAPMGVSCNAVLQKESLRWLLVSRLRGRAVQRSFFGANPLLRLGAAAGGAPDPQLGEDLGKKLLRFWGVPDRRKLPLAESAVGISTC